MENFYKELPDNYIEYKVIDAKKKSTVIWFNVISILLAFIIVGLFYVLLKPKINNLLYVSISLLVFIISMIIYVIFHELVHGLFYKIFTKEKLTFGLTLSVAFCGVPNIYVSKKTAFFSVLAPFVIFSIIFLLGIFLIPNDYAKSILILLFGIHIGGCIGDLYVAFILIKSRGKILMNDTGPKQTFYKYVSNN